MKDCLAVSSAVALPHLGHLIGYYAVKDKLETWYKDLQKPSWHPPQNMLTPVYTVLYSGMGYASYLIWKDGGGFQHDAKIPLTLYVVQLGLNWTWPLTFFKTKRLDLATVHIGALWSCVAGCIYLFRPINKTASLLMVPYLLWLTFGTALTANMCCSNKQKSVEACVEEKSEKEGKVEKKKE